MNKEQWLTLGETLFGQDKMQWKFKCPCCGHIGSKTNITWHQGDTSCATRQYYFCKLGRFTLTLLTDTEQNLTRTEVYFGHHKQLIYTSEKEISKEAATVELQNFLSGLAVELQTLSHIEFPEQV